MKNKTLETKWLGFIKIKLRNYTILQTVIFHTCLIYFFTLKNVKLTEKLKEKSYFNDINLPLIEFINC